MNRAAVKLSPRERQVKKLDAAGKQRKEIAAILGIAPGTVYAHLAQIKLKSSITGKTT